MYSFEGKFGMSKPFCDNKKIKLFFISTIYWFKSIQYTEFMI